MGKKHGWRRPLERNIDFDRKFLYIHIPKTAGTAIKKALGLDPKAAHGKYFHYQERLGRRKYEGFKKVTFVRNPWDRFLSFYLYTRMEENFHHSNRDPDKTEFGKNRHYDLLVNASLNQCAHYLIEGRFKPLSGEFYFMAPQCDWLVDGSGNMHADFVGCYESIEKDFQKLTEVVGLAGGPLETMNASPRDKANFRDYYDPETRALIAKYYEEDIDQFQYTF